MVNCNMRLLVLGVIVLTAVAQRDGTRRVTDTSQDGTQTGDITLAGDGSSGRVSASSTGGRRAGSSVSLTVTGGPSTSASFSSRGDGQSASGSLSSGRGRRRSRGRNTPSEPAPSMLGGSSTGDFGSSSSSDTSESSESSESSSSEGTSDSSASSTSESSASSTQVVSSRSGGDVEPDEVEEVVDEIPEASSASVDAETVEAVESSGSGDADESEDSQQDAEEALEGAFGAAVSVAGAGHGAWTSLIPGDSTSQGRKKICVRSQSEFQQHLKEGYEVTLVRKVSGGNVEVLREFRDGSSISRSRIVSSAIPEQVKKECGITEATLGIKKRTGGSFTSVSSSSRRSGSSSSRRSGSSSTVGSGSYASTGSIQEPRRSPRQEGILRLCSKGNLKKFTGLKGICQHLLEREQSQKKGDIFDIKSEFG